MQLSPVAVGPFLPLSDHAPFSARVDISTPATVDFIAVSLLENEGARKRAKALYETHLPQLVTSLNGTNSVEELERTSRELAT